MSFGKAEVAQPLDDFPVARVELELSVLPGAVDIVRYVVPVDNIYDDPSVVEDESLRIVPFPYRVLNGERSVQPVAGRMVDR